MRSSSPETYSRDVRRVRVRRRRSALDVCTTTRRVVTRQTEAEPAMIRTAVRACAEACRLCAQECETHATEMDMEHCRVCAEACNGALSAVGVCPTFDSALSTGRPEPMPAGP